MYSKHLIYAVIFPREACCRERSEQFRTERSACKYNMLDLSLLDWLTSCNLFVVFKFKICPSVVS